jgi:large subunit ribosomal protein L23
MAIFKREKKNTAAEAEKTVVEKVVKAEKVKKTSTTKKTTTKTKKDTKTVDKKAVKLASRLATATLLHPIVSEKAAHLADQGVITFKVTGTANRIAIRQAFRELYKVTPVKVNIIRMRGTQKRFGQRTGRTKDYKKALIHLPKGVRIDVFEGV